TTAVGNVQARERYVDPYQSAGAGEHRPILRTRDCAAAAHLSSIDWLVYVRRWAAGDACACAAVETVPISNDLRSGPDCGVIVPEWGCRLVIAGSSFRGR